MSKINTAGTVRLGRRHVKRLGYGAMQLAGPGVFGPPKDRDGALAVLREAVAAGVDHVDTSDFYGPHVTNQPSLLSDVARGLGATPMQVALAWLLRRAPGGKRGGVRRRRPSRRDAAWRRHGGTADAAGSGGKTSGEEAPACWHGGGTRTVRLGAREHRFKHVPGTLLIHGPDERHDHHLLGDRDHRREQLRWSDKRVETARKSRDSNRQGAKDAKILFSSWRSWRPWRFISGRST